MHGTYPEPSLGLLAAGSYIEDRYLILNMSSKRKSKGPYMISAVAEMYEIHPQTLRRYEREATTTAAPGETGWRTQASL